MEENNFKKTFEEDIQKIESEEMLSPDYQKKKLIKYVVRTIIAIIIYVVFWEYEWVRWTLWFYVPLNLLGLVALLGMPFLMKRKLKKTIQRIDDLDEKLKKIEDE